MVPVAGIHHLQGVNVIAVGERKALCIDRMSRYADELLIETTGLLEVFTTLQNQGEFQTEAIRAEAVSTDNGTERVVQVKWAGLDESEIT